MIIDENTKLIGRFHKKMSPRGLNIYNPFFQESNLNAVFLLFYDEDPKVLIDGFRSLNMQGAITAGFESDDRLPSLLDSIDESAKFVGKVGYITNNGGKIIGHSQGGRGMFETIRMVSKIQDQNLVIVGAGNIAKGLFYEIEKEKINCNVTLVNRDLNKAGLLKDRFSFIDKIVPFDEIDLQNGDVFVNLTHIGGSVTDYQFSNELISKFSSIVDVTFETEETELIKSSKNLNKKYATGWDMFTNQGLVVLEGMFNQKFDFQTFRKHVAQGLSEGVK